MTARITGGVASFAHRHASRGGGRRTHSCLRGGDERDERGGREDELFTALNEAAPLTRANEGFRNPCWGGGDFVDHADLAGLGLYPRVGETFTGRW